ncbi:tRNA (guanine-N(1)-)-methyltransferase [Pseudohyphozyma bogoriensis]|nr:tRNA (guanine-N(1)-)-methyltransferase [Pseudohyphozyma bogoriensis]
MSRKTSGTIPQPTLTPPVHRGMAELDRSLFAVQVPLVAAVVPAPLTTEIARGDLKDYLLRVDRTGHVAHDPSSADLRRIVLRISDKSLLPTELVDALAQQGVTFTDHTLDIGYDYWTADQVLQAVLPEELLDESPTSYTQVGHIAHLNLRDEYLPHRHLIGRVILDKNKSLRTVVNKLDTIDNTFRNFKMEVLAGDDDFVVNTSEEGCSFTFDFSKVYWNSRLQTEHARLVESFSPKDVVVDAFAGVGPFAIPAGKKGCGVMASDLNPASAASLAENAKNNKVEATVRTANEDARAYIRQSVLDVWNQPFPPYEPPMSAKARGKLAHEAAKAKAAGLPPPSAPETTKDPDRRLVNHFVMNLPASAIEFLDAFKGLYSELYKLEGAREAVEASSLPMVHCYCFTKDVEHAEEDILERATQALGMPVTTSTKDYNLRFVRDVAPKKEMYCLEFRLSPEMVA